VDTSNAGLTFNDSNGSAIFDLNGLATTNVITNPGFELNGNAATPTGWAKLNGAETTFLTDNGVLSHDGAENLKVVTAAGTANQGAKYVYQFAANTTYQFNIWAAASAGFSTFDLGTVQNGGAQTTCLSAQTLTTTLQQFSCTFTTGSTIQATDYIFVRDSSTTSHTIYLDTAVLQSTNSAMTNFVGNPSFENGNVNGWAVKGATGTAVAISTDTAKFGTQSLKATMGTVADQGIQYSTPLLGTTQYSLSMWVRKDTGSFALLDIGFNENGTNHNCLTSQTADTTWRQFTCTYTTTAVGATPTIYVKHGTDTTSEVLYIDGVTLVQASSGLSFSTPAEQIQADSQLNQITLNGGNNGDLTPWKATTSLSTANADHAGVIHNGFLYIVGGGNSGTAVNTVMYAKINADGTLGSWTTSGSTLPATRQSLSSVVVNGYLYALGGETGGTAVNTVYFAKLNQDGTVGAWQTNPYNLPVITSRNAAVTANGYIYEMGGGQNSTGGSATANVYSAKVNADGSTSSWSTPNAMPAARYEHAATVANGYIYVTGGSTNDTTPKDTVFFTKLNSDGTLGSWFCQGTAAACGTAVNSYALPQPRTKHSTTVANGYLYVIGGNSVGGSNLNAVNTVFFSKLNADGSTGSWQVSASPLPTVLNEQVTATANGYVYAAGGWTTSCCAAAITNVYFSSFARTILSGSLDLIGLSGQTMSDPGSGGSITAGDIRAIGTLRVDDQAILNNGLTVSGPVTFQSPGTGSNAFSINNNTTGINLLDVKDLNTNFGSAITAGAFISRNSYWGEEFNNGHATNCGGTFTVAGGDINGYARGDYGNAGTATACTLNNTNTANVGGGELNASFSNGAAAGSCTLASQNTANGVERITATSAVTASSTANCVENLAATATTSNKVAVAANLPVVTMKIKPSTLTAASNNARIQVGLVSQDTAAGLGANSPTNSIYFTNCSTWNNAAAPTGCSNTTWYGVTSGAAAATVVTCSGTMSTAQFAYLRIEVRSTTDVHFFVDVDTSNGITETECGTGSTTNITASGMTPWMQAMFMTNTVTTTALDIDYFRMWQDDNIPAQDQVQPADGTAEATQSLTTAPISADSPDPDIVGSFFNFLGATSEDTVINNNLFVHGTIYADKIKANQIEGLEIFTDALASLQQKLAQNSSTSTNPTSTTTNNTVIQTATTTINLNDGLTVGGDANFHGNVFFYKLVTFMEKTVFNNDVSFAAHVTTDGQVPAYNLEAAAGDNAAPASIDGNDNAGQLTVNIGDNAASGELLTVNFAKPYAKAPRVLLTSSNGAAAQLHYYVTSTATGFKIIVTDTPASGTTLLLNYWVVQ
jgi:hypothetical protein